VKHMILIQDYSH